MTVTEKSSRKIISGSGWTNPLTHDYMVENASYVHVYADTVELVQGVDYVVSDVGEEAGYVVTIVDDDAWTPGVWILDARPPIAQGKDLTVGGVFGAKYEDGLDQLARRLQRVYDLARRGLKTNLEESVGDNPYTLPSASANTFLGWNAAGADLENKLMQGLGLVQVRDEDDMASDSHTDVPSQHSVRARIEAAEAPFQTVAAAATYRPIFAPQYIRTASHTSLQYGGGAVYRMVGSEPTHIGKFSLTLLLGGVVWYEIVDDGKLIVNCYGAISDNTNASNGTVNNAFIQGMLDHLGYYRLAGGRYKITEKLTIPSHAVSLRSIGAKFTGIGKEKSTLVAFGMAGKSMFGPAGLTGLYRVHMADHALIGDADRAVDFEVTPGGSNILYESSFINIQAWSVAKEAFYSNVHFACRWEGCSFSSTNGHSIEIQGGNSTVLVNCYAHQCGDGEAGFRIWGHAVLEGCVGIDKPTGPCHWLWAGNTAAGAIFQIAIIGGNCEDFGTSGIKLEGSGQIRIDNLNMYARASGTFQTYIENVDNNVVSIQIEGTVRASSKGAARLGSSNIEGVGASVSVYNPSASGAGSFPDYYNRSAVLLYEIPVSRVIGAGFGRYSLECTHLHSRRESGFVASTITDITANATTYSMATLTNLLRTANTAPTLLTNVTIPAAVAGGFNGAVDGQELRLIINDAFTTVRHLIGGAGRFEMIDSADRVCVTGEVLEFVWLTSIWRQVNPRRKLRASATVDPASMPLVGDCTPVATIAVPGAVLGDFVRASFSQSLAGASLHVYVSVADTVAYFFRNDVGAAPNDIPSGTLRIEVSKA